jgi:L-threonylcarbamoyladenylate synthase
MKGSSYFFKNQCTSVLITTNIQNLFVQFVAHYFCMPSHSLETIVLSSTPQNITKAAQILRSGGNVAFPTETVYGLGACVFRDDAVRSIFLAKGRPSDNPLIVHCAEKRDVERIADLSRLTSQQQVLFDTLYTAFCPGALTFILPKRATVPDSVTAGLNTVAVRFPKHPVALALIREAGEPLVAPSANRSGYPSPTTAAHVLHDLEGRIEAVLDGGTCELGIESTVINILSEPLHILRPGSITQKDMQSIATQFGLNVVVPTSNDEVLSKEEGNAAPRSPGMKYRHYAPKARVILAESEQAAFLHAQNYPATRIFAYSSHSSNTSIYSLSEQNLYAELRKADDDGLDAVIVIADDVLRSNAGLMNRLAKASEGGSTPAFKVIS